MVLQHVGIRRRIRSCFAASRGHITAHDVSSPLDAHAGDLPSTSLTVVLRVSARPDRWTFVETFTLASKIMPLCVAMLALESESTVWFEEEWILEGA